MRRSKRLDYKQLNETGEKVEKEEVESNQTEEVSNLFRTISISKDLQSLNIKESLAKQKADALVIDEATIGEDIDDYIDENNNAENVLSIEEIDEKIQRIEELRTAYRRKHNKLKVLLGSNYEEIKKRLTSVKNYIMKTSMMKRDFTSPEQILCPVNFKTPSVKLKTPSSVSYKEKCSTITSSTDGTEIDKYQEK